MASIRPVMPANHLDFSCFSCKEHVEQLSCLPCLHSVSVCHREECRQNLSNHGVCCHLCKEHFDLPPEGFPRHSFAERTAAAKKVVSKGMFCRAKHSTPQVAVVFCSDCSGPLCEECHGGHKTVAILSEHRIVPLEDTVKAGLGMMQDCSLLCSAHNKAMECFCLDCEALICTVCPVVGLHQSHSVLLVDKEVGEQNQHILEQCITSPGKRVEEMSAAVRDVDSRMLALHEESNRCKEAIADLKEHMIEAVNRRCAVLVAEVEEAEEKRKEDLAQHKNALKAQINQIDLFTTSAREIIQEGSTSEQLSLRQAIIQRTSLLAFSPPPPAPFLSSSVFLVSEKKEEVEKVLSILGRVSLGPDAETSSIDMSGLPTVDNTIECHPWSLPMGIRVVSRDSKGLECVRGGEKVEPLLTPISCGVPVQGEVEDRGDGTYQITFRCLPSEECRLSVTVNGSEITGSPVRVRASDFGIVQEIRDSEPRCLHALVFTKEGTLLATDSTNGEVCCFAQSGELLSSFKVLNSGSFLPGLAVLSDGSIAVSVYDRHMISVYRLCGELVREFGSDRLDGPRGLAANHRGQLFVADAWHHRVFVFTENGKSLYSFGGKGTDPGQFQYPHQICIDQNDLVYVSDGNHRIQVFEHNSGFVRQFGQGVLHSPIGVALTNSGHILVTSRGTGKLTVFHTQTGECVHEVKEIDLGRPFGVATAADGSIFVADYACNGRIVRLCQFLVALPA